MTRRGYSLAVACVAIALALTACGRADNGKQRIGFSQIGSESGWRAAETNVAKAEAVKRGLELNISDAQQKQENQIRAVKAFIAQKKLVGGSSFWNCDATAGTPYAFTVTSTGTPDATYSVTSGALPAGLVLDGVTGAITGTPTTTGTSTFTITASNGVGTAASAVLGIEIFAAVAGAAVPTAALLPPTGGEPSVVLALVAVAAAGAGFVVLVHRASRGAGRHRLGRASEPLVL